jgi:hypothetical protein
MARLGNKWNINELLALQREYELLEWSVQQISDKHQRSVLAIMYRLEDEGFISSWEEARGFNYAKFQEFGSCENIQTESEDEEEDKDKIDVDSEYVDENSNENSEEDENSDENLEEDELTNRVWNLETSVKEISTIVKQMFKNLVLKKTTKRAPLRQQL